MSYAVVDGRDDERRLRSRNRRVALMIAGIAFVCYVGIYVVYFVAANR